MDSEASSQSSDSGAEGQGLSQVSRKPKQRRNQCKAWNFQDALHTDLLGKEGVAAYEKTNMLTKHLQTRLGHKQPSAVHSVTVLKCLLQFRNHWVSDVAFDRCKPFDSNSHHWIRLIPEQSSLHDDQMAPRRYICPSPLLLGRPPRFSAVHEPCREHCRALVQAFCIWRAGCQAERALENLKVLCKPVHPLPRPAVWLNILVHWQVLLPAIVPLQPWTLMLPIKIPISLKHLHSSRFALPTHEAHPLRPRWEEGRSARMAHQAQPRLARLRHPRQRPSPSHLQRCWPLAARQRLLH